MSMVFMVAKRRHATYTNRWAQPKNKDNKAQ
jgi:hypothetical protein